MSYQRKVEYQQLQAGDELSPISRKLDAVTISNYLKAVEESSNLYQTGKLVPPMAVAACAIAVLFDAISLPPGAIHVTQELEFLASVNVEDTITCNTKVTRKQDRGGLHLMTVGIDVYNQNQQKVLAGITSFVAP